MFSPQKSNQSSTELLISNDEEQLEDPPPRKVVKTSNFRVKATNSHCLKAFTEKIGHNIFHPKNVNTKIKKEKLLRKLKFVQDKGPRFVVISNDEL